MYQCMQLRALLNEVSPEYSICVFEDFVLGDDGKPIDVEINYFFTIPTHQQTFWKRMLTENTNPIAFRYMQSVITHAIIGEKAQAISLFERMLDEVFDV